MKLAQILFATALAGCAAATAAQELTLFESENFGGRRFSHQRIVAQSRRHRFQRPRLIRDRPRGNVAALFGCVLSRRLRHAAAGQLSVALQHGSRQNACRRCARSAGTAKAVAAPAGRAATLRARGIRRRQHHDGANTSQLRSVRLQRPRAVADRVLRHMATVLGRIFQGRLPQLGPGRVRQPGRHQRPDSSARPTAQRRRRWGGAGRRRAWWRWRQLGRANTRRAVRVSEFFRAIVHAEYATSSAIWTEPDSTIAHRRSGSKAATGCSAPMPDSRARAAPSAPANTLRCRGTSTTGYRPGGASRSNIHTTRRLHGVRRTETIHADRSTTSRGCAAFSATAGRSPSSDCPPIGIAQLFRRQVHAGQRLSHHSGQSELPRSARPEVLRRLALDSRPRRYRRLLSQAG